VRRAIDQAIDIEGIHKDVMRGLALPAGMLVGPSTVGYVPAPDQRLPYDPMLPNGYSRRPVTRRGSGNSGLLEQLQDDR
jgi:hypothetical protein